MLLRISVSTLLILCGSAAHAADAADAPPAKPPTVVDFAKRAQYYDLEISPEGHYLAVTVPLEDRTVLAVLNLTDLKISSVLKFGPGEHVDKFWWAGEKHVLASVATKIGELAEPLLTGELLSMDPATGTVKYLFGYRGSQQVGSHINGATKERAWADFIAVPDNDPDTAIISVRFWDSGDDGTAILYRLNLQTGARGEIGHAPLPGGAEFLADRQGKVRYVVIRDVQNKQHTFWRDAAGEAWQEETAGNLATSHISPLRFSDDGKSVYLASTEGADTHCLIRRELFGEHARSNIGCNFSKAIFSFDDREPIAFLRDYDKPRVEALDSSSHPDKTLLMRLEKSFKGDIVVPVSSTRDGARVVLLVQSDRNPGDFYLYDRGNGKAAYLVSRRDWIDPDQMGERRAIEFSARDGHPLEGYLTLPPGASDPKGLPMIVLPHGGPFGFSDNWYWDAEPQMLATHGYAVLQVNFRGSGGYGIAHRDAGKLHWGTTMIDDITDGVREVIGKGWADPTRLCIYGGSYGGYAALMSAVREPDLYRCTVGYDGIYDMAIQVSESDTSESESGRNSLRDYMGTTKEILHDQSPINYLDQLKATVFLAHGKLDKRTPYSQYKTLAAALDKRHIPYESLVESNEGHGFYVQEHREELYKRMLQFFDRNIGSASPAATATTAKPAN